MTRSESTHISRIFEYPDADYMLALESLTNDIAPTNPKTAEHLRRFADTLRDKSSGEIAELFSNTFDLSPACTPYLSVHLFGEGSFKRASLMSGLMETYLAMGLQCRGELPDHLAVVLRAIESLDTAIREELVSLCLMPALAKMESELRRQHNPYLHAVLAVQGWLSQLPLGREVKCA